MVQINQQSCTTGEMALLIAVVLKRVVAHFIYGFNFLPKLTLLSICNIKLGKKLFI
jgi:hypothetical protein